MFIIKSLNFKEQYDSKNNSLILKWEWISLPYSIQKLWLSEVHTELIEYHRKWSVLGVFLYSSHSIWSLFSLSTLWHLGSHGGHITFAGNRHILTAAKAERSRPDFAAIVIKTGVNRVTPATPLWRPFWDEMVPVCACDCYFTLVEALNGVNLQMFVAFSYPAPRHLFVLNTMPRRTMVTTILCPFNLILSSAHSWLILSFFIQDVPLN